MAEIDTQQQIVQYQTEITQLVVQMAACREAHVENRISVCQLCISSDARITNLRTIVNILKFPRNNVSHFPIDTVPGNVNNHLKRG